MLGSVCLEVFEPTDGGCSELQRLQSADHSAGADGVDCGAKVNQRVLAFSRWLRAEWGAEKMASVACLDSRPGGIWALKCCIRLSMHRLQHHCSARLVNCVDVH